MIILVSYRFVTIAVVASEKYIFIAKPSMH